LACYNSLYHFFSVGLFALWKNQFIAKGWKIGVTIFFALLIMARVSAIKNKTEEISEKTNASTKPELSKEQKDSIAQIERLAAIEERKKNTITAGDIVSQYEENEVGADVEV
jgi:hypothetical protein